MVVGSVDGVGHANVGVLVLVMVVGMRLMLL